MPSIVPTHALPVRNRASRNTGTAPRAATQTWVMLSRCGPAPNQ